MVNRVKMLEEELRGMAMRADVAEAERDEALARTEKDGAVISTLQGDFLRVERERDVWKARAEAAERELTDEYGEAKQKAAAWDRVAAHPALKMDLLPEADHTYAGGVFERITWLAEAAEARTAPAVPLHRPDGTRMDAPHLPIDADDDPAVFVVWESDIAAVGIERDKDQGWTIPGRGWGWVWHSTAEELRNYARENCDRAAACEAVARAIEAEQAVDPPDGHDVHARSGTVWLDSIDHTPDEAVDLARALLAAAEEARDGVDR